MTEISISWNSESQNSVLAGIVASRVSDPFHPDVKEEHVDELLGAIALVPHLEVRILTKFADRMLEYFESMETESKFGQFLSDQSWHWAEKYQILPRWYSEPNLFDNPKETAAGTIYDVLVEHCNHEGFPNLMLGVSVEDQETADERVPLLLKTPAAKRFLSVEPMLEAIDFSECSACMGEGYFDGPGHPMSLEPPRVECEDCNGLGCLEFPLEDLDLVICGGESGKDARPFDINWARSLRDQCADSGTPFHLKQLGSNPVDGANSIKSGFKGQNVSLWPEDLRKCHLGSET